MVINAHARTATDRLVVPIGRSLARLGATPNGLTTFGVFATFAGAAVVLAGHHMAGALMLAVATATDALDGTVARLRGTASAWGSFYDSVSDRISDVVLFGAALWLVRDDATAFTVGVVALASALLTSYIRAKAESLGWTATVGLLERPRAGDRADLGRRVGTVDAGAVGPGARWHRHGRPASGGRASPSRAAMTPGARSSAGEGYRGSGLHGQPVDRRPGAAQRVPPRPPDTRRQRAMGELWLAGWQLARWLPESVALGIADTLARAAARRAGPARQRVRANLARVVDPSEVDATVDAAYRSYARYWIEAFRAADIGADELRRRVTVDGIEAFERRTRAGTRRDHPARASRVVGHRSPLG